MKQNRLDRTDQVELIKQKRPSRIDEAGSTKQDRRSRIDKAEPISPLHIPLPLFYFASFTDVALWSLPALLGWAWNDRLSPAMRLEPVFQRLVPVLHSVVPYNGCHPKPVVAQDAAASLRLSLTMSLQVPPRVNRLFIPPERE